MSTTSGTDLDAAPGEPLPRYGRAYAAVHWFLAIAIVGMLAFGFLVIAGTPEQDPAKIAMVRAHIVVGLTITAVLVVWVIVGLRTRRPPPLPDGRPALDRLAKATHHLLRATTAALVLSGIATAAMSGIPPVVFGHAADHLPAATPGLPAFRFHALLALLLAALVVLHVAGALFHALVKRDRIFARMSVFDRRPGRPR